MDTARGRKKQLCPKTISLYDNFRLSAIRYIFLPARNLRGITVARVHNIIILFYYRYY